jgi:hypothetical protein
MFTEVALSNFLVRCYQADDTWPILHTYIFTLLYCEGFLSCPRKDIALQAASHAKRFQLHI